MLRALSGAAPLCHPNRSQVGQHKRPPFPSMFCNLCPGPPLREAMGQEVPFAFVEPVANETKEAFREAMDAIVRSGGAKWKVWKVAGCRRVGVL